MTNEEKAREIAKNNECYYTEPHYKFGELQDIEINSYNECEKSALDMAQWKDRQFREILRKRWKESQANPNDEQLKIALFDEIMDIFLGED